VAAVVAAMTEAASEGANTAPLDDLIAKAAQAVEQHVGAVRGSRLRGQSQSDRARASLRAATGSVDPVTPHKLDVIR
jgi:hypothetical protein